MAAPGTDSVKIAELVATLSYAADLGLGQPMEHCMRQTVLAPRLADLLGADEYEREATYYLGLLMNAYCHADAAEQAKWFGDDISFKGDGFETLDMNTAQTIAFLLGSPIRSANCAPNGLTMREVQVLALLARGCSNREIGQQLVVTPKTVPTTWNTSTRRSTCPAAPLRRCSRHRIH